MKNFFSPSSKKTISSQMRSGTFIIVSIIVIIFLLLSLFSLSYHNRNATNGYQLKVLQAERRKIMFEIETLEMQIADLSAINRSVRSEEGEISQLQEDRKSLEFVDYEDRDYKTKIIYLKGTLVSS